MGSDYNKSYGHMIILCNTNKSCHPNVICVMLENHIYIPTSITFRDEANPRCTQFVNEDIARCIPFRDETISE
jgi:hypothetical protein